MRTRALLLLVCFALALVRADTNQLLTITIQIPGGSDVWFSTDTKQWLQVTNATFMTRIVGLSFGTNQVRWIYTTNDARVTFCNCTNVTSLVTNGEVSRE